MPKPYLDALPSEEEDSEQPILLRQTDGRRRSGRFVAFDQRRVCREAPVTADKAQHVEAVRVRLVHRFANGIVQDRRAFFEA